MKIISDLWHGKVSLAKTYWIYGVIFSNIVGVLIGYLMDLAALEGFFSAVILLLIIYLAIVVHVLVSIWRSAGTYILNKNQLSKSTFWGYVARVMVVLGALLVVSAFVQGYLYG